MDNNILPLDKVLAPVLPSLLQCVASPESILSSPGRPFIHGQWGDRIHHAVQGMGTPDCIRRLQRKSLPRFNYC